MNTLIRLAIILVASLYPNHSVAQSKFQLTYQPAPVDNPLKGLVPYQADVRSRFPHSLEFNYIPYSALVKDYDVYDWQPLEQLLNDVASRGHQAVIRIFLEYPDKSGIIPPFLLNSGLKVHRYLNTNTQPFPPAQVETPDYEDANLRKSLKNFIAAFGKKYDGDPRLGFITAGLLGTWGEWHTYPREELFASKTVQNEVLSAYEAAFKITPVLLRYPAGKNDEQKAPNATRNFGYHDDSFAWATLHTGKKDEEWFFLSALKQAGKPAEEKWKTHPIGGEIRPEAWKIVFDPHPSNPQVQDFQRCVQETHVSWLMDSGMFEKKQPPDRINRAIDQVRKMGYEFHLPFATLQVATTNTPKTDSHTLKIEVNVENRGVAPFYYPWKTEYALLDATTNQPVTTLQGTGLLTGLLPESPARVWKESFELKGIPSGDYTIATRVPNPLAKGNPVRFANKEQDRDAPTWCSLGTIALPTLE